MVKHNARRPHKAYARSGGSASSSHLKQPNPAQAKPIHPKSAFKGELKGERRNNHYLLDQADEHEEIDFYPPLKPLKENRSANRGIIPFITRLDVGLIGLLLLSLAVGIFIGSSIKDQTELLKQEERKREAAFIAEATPKMQVSFNIQEDALKKYYEERMESLPAELRADPNSAPIDALAAKEIPDAPKVAKPRQAPSIIQPIPEKLQEDIQPAESIIAEKNESRTDPLKDGQPQWLAYASKAVSNVTGPMVAIVIDDMGLDKARSERAIALKAPITVSFLAYANNIDDLIAKARIGGDDIMLHIPMEPISRDADPGPNALLTGLSDEEIMSRLKWNLERIDHVVGVNNHMGSLFTSNARQMGMVLDEINKRGLFFLDSVTSAKSQGYRIAQAMNMPHTVRDVFIDDDKGEASILKQLSIIEQTALKKGHAIAIGHPHDTTLSALENWLPTLKDKGITLVPITTIIKQQQGITDIAIQETPPIKLSKN